MPQHVIVLHRWTDHYADYAGYLDHSAHRVSYVTTDRAARHLPLESAAGVRIVGDTEDVKAVREAVDALAEHVGPPTAFVALQETDLDLAARLREDFDLPGPRETQLRPLRDKLAMAQRLTAAGVPTPDTAEAGDRAAVAEFAATHGWPVVVKPRRGTASAGVTRVDSARELAGHTFPEGDELLVQPWVAAQVLHVDGVFTGSGLEQWRASRYLSTCLDFTAGAALGSVEIDDAPLLTRIAVLTVRALSALVTGPTVFHLELFLDEGGALTVLEAGARPGGAEVPFVWREVHGVDLMAIAFAHQAGTPAPAFPEAHPADEVAGWLVVPPSVPAPCRVRSVTVAAEKGPYAEVLPAVGALMPGGGYEHAGARFRFRGRSSADVEAAVRRTAAATTLTSDPVDPAAPARLVVVGCGNPPYRQYALEALAGRVETGLVQSVPAQSAGIDWQRHHVGDRMRTADTADPADTARAVAELLTGTEGPGAVLTWDETLLRTTAEVARRLGLPHMSPRAVRGCRDKLTTRRLLLAAGVPSARFRQVHDRDEAVGAARELGFPAVVKPRALAGSVGVVLAEDRQQAGDAYERARTASFPGIDQLGDVIVEEYLTGEEVSVDCVVVDGEALPVNVARKRLGYAPYFEETGHLVAPWQDEPWALRVRSVVAAAHRALGVRTGVTHTELRLTPTGPRVIEVNGRLGGDFVPLLGALATGVDQIAAAADLALGRTPDLTPSRDRCAEVRFVYPGQDALVRSLDLTDAAAVPGIAHAVALAGPGTELRLPPRGVVPRLAALIAFGGSPRECADTLDRAARSVHAALDPLPARP